MICIPCAVEMQGRFNNHIELVTAVPVKNKDARQFEINLIYTPTMTAWDTWRCTSEILSSLTNITMPELNEIYDVLLSGDNEAIAFLNLKYSI